MEISFRVAARIARPVEEVFEAVADPEQLSRYFTTGGAEGRLQGGRIVIWQFAEAPGAFPVRVYEVATNRRIVLQWGATEAVSGEIGAEMHESDYRTVVTITFAPIDRGARTLVEIIEGGWQPTPGALRGSYMNCEGWTGMLLALKAWLEHGITLREGLYA